MVNRVVRGMPGRQVGTVGRIQAFPGAPNVIPGKVVCTLELRDLDDAKVDSMYATIRKEADAIGKQNGTQFAYSELHVNTAAPTDPRMRKIITAAAASLGLSPRPMPRGAGTTLRAMAVIGKIGPIFYSERRRHQPLAEEFSSAADIANGANVLG